MSVVESIDQLRGSQALHVRKSGRIDNWLRSEGGIWRHAELNTFATDRDFALDINEGNVHAGCQPEAGQYWYQEGAAYGYLILDADWQVDGGGPACVLLARMVHSRGTFDRTMVLTPEQVPGAPVREQDAPDWVATVRSLSRVMVMRESQARQHRQQMDEVMADSRDSVDNFREQVATHMRSWADGYLSVSEVESMETVLVDTLGCRPIREDVTVNACVNGICERVIQPAEVHSLLPGGVDPHGESAMLQLPFHVDIPVVRRKETGLCACPDVTDDDIRSLLGERGVTAVSFEVDKECSHCE